MMFSFTSWFCYFHEFPDFTEPAQNAETFFLLQIGISVKEQVKTKANLRMFHKNKLTQLQ